MFTFENIYKAYKCCRKNKTNTINVLKFEQNLLENLWELVVSLQDRSYSIGKSTCFLASSPKLREIFAADFKDRVVHHVLIAQIEAMYEKKFIYDLYSNRKSKGTHRAKERIEKWMRAEEDASYLQLDIKGFFYNLDKDILYKMMHKDIQKSSLLHKDDILWLAHTLIYHDSTKNYVFKGNKSSLEALPAHKTLFKLAKNKGLPIGNLTSQFFANVYMNRFDHFVKRELKCKHYARYVDDFILLHNDKEVLSQHKKAIETYLKKHLALSLREDTKLKKTKEGLDFLGYVIRPSYTLVRKRVVQNYKRKKAQYLDRYEAQKGKMGLAEIKVFLSVQASFASHIKHANSFRLRQSIGVLKETDPFAYGRD